MLPFVGVDGEGHTVDGRHKYMLLCAGQHTLYTGNPLTTIEILGFLSDLPDDAIYVSFAFDYDVTMFFQRSPRRDKIEQIVARSNRSNLESKNRMPPVLYGEFLVRYVPGKFFEVKRASNRKGKYTRIFDTVGFFQTSFVKALEAWQVTDDETLAFISEHKDIRSLHVVNAEVIKYCQAECSLLAALMDKVRDATLSCGYTLRSWHGAGALADTMLDSNGVIDYLPSEPNLEINEKACHAYYGGRFENTVQATFIDVKMYDINSAYPYALCQLPCLAHGYWSQEPGSSIYIAKVSWDIIRWGTNKMGHYLLGPLPFRRPNGNIIFPTNGTGYYWSPEVEALKRYAERMPTDIEIDDIWYWHPGCDHKPFEFIPEMYRQRKLLGKSDAGKVIKLGMNSLYGKTVQTVGTAKYSSPIWAGMTTSITRAQILDAITESIRCNVKILMIATDSITTDRDLNALPVGSELGEWEGPKKLMAVHIFLPGIYFDPRSKTDENTVVKTRGFPAKYLNQLKKDVRKGLEVTIKRPFFNGMRYVAHRGNWNDYGQWTEIETTYSPKALASKRSLRLKVPIIHKNPFSGQFMHMGYAHAPYDIKLLRIASQHVGDTIEQTNAQYPSESKPYTKLLDRFATTIESNAQDTRDSLMDGMDEESNIRFPLERIE